MCLVEILPLSLPKLNNGTEVLQIGLRTVFLILPHIVGNEYKGEKKQWLLTEYKGKENDSLFPNMGLSS